MPTLPKCDRLRDVANLRKAEHQAYDTFHQRLVEKNVNLLFPIPQPINAWWLATQKKKYEKKTPKLKSRSLSGRE